MRFNFILTVMLLFAGISATNAQQLLQANKNFKKQHQSTSKQAALPVPGSVAARPAGNSPVRQKCGFASYMERAKARGYNETEYENELKRLVQKRIETGQTAFTGIVTIPVVFHVLY